jgi:preprotein translocase subunit SecD
MNRIKLQYVFIVILLHVCILHAKAQDVIQFILTNENIEEISIVDYEQELFSVIIKLKEDYRKELSKLTKKNIGNYLVVKYYDMVLVEAYIKGTINSGIITIGEWDNFEEAKEFLGILNQKESPR